MPYTFTPVKFRGFVHYDVFQNGQIIARVQGKGNSFLVSCKPNKQGRFQITRRLCEDKQAVIDLLNSIKL